MFLFLHSVRVYLTDLWSGLTGCGLKSWSASGRLYRTFPAGKWWVGLFMVKPIIWMENLTGLFTSK